MGIVRRDVTTDRFYEVCATPTLLYGRKREDTR